MNIELTDQMEDEIIRAWLKENVRHSKDDDFCSIDPEFWGGVWFALSAHIGIELA